MKFKQDDLVEIHSLGPSYQDQTFEGKICGLSVDWGDSPATIWIVECPGISSLSPVLGVPFSHITMPQACLRNR